MIGRLRIVRVCGHHFQQTGGAIHTACLIFELFRALSPGAKEKIYRRMWQGSVETDLCQARNRSLPWAGGNPSRGRNKVWFCGALRGSPGRLASQDKAYHSLFQERWQPYDPEAMCAKGAPPEVSQASILRQRVSLETSQSSLGIAAFDKQRRVIPPNPSAGEVRSREVRYGPWMAATNRRIEAENTKARHVLFEKRVFGLAKQATYSLEGVGIHYEMTMIANILRTACKHRALLADEQQLANSPTKERDEVEVEHACRVLDACLQFDARRLATLLGFNMKVHKTFGEGIAL